MGHLAYLTFTFYLKAVQWEHELQQKLRQTAVLRQNLYLALPAYHTLYIHRGRLLSFEYRHCSI